MFKYLLRHCRSAGSLSGEAQERLFGLCTDVRDFDSGAVLTANEESGRQAVAILDGWAGSFMLLPNGTRQFTALSVPGDLINPSVAVASLEYGVLALTPCRAAFVPHSALAETAGRYPDLDRVLHWFSRTDESRLRNWILSLGRREPEERVAHLLCELHIRMERVGLAENGPNGEAVFPFPLDREQVADAAGLTPLHASRVLERLETRKLLSLRFGKARIADLAELRRIAAFDPHHLCEIRAPEKSAPPAAAG